MIIVCSILTVSTLTDVSVEYMMILKILIEMRFVIDTFDTCLYPAANLCCIIFTVILSFLLLWNTDDYERHLYHWKSNDQLVHGGNRLVRRFSKRWKMAVCKNRPLVYQQQTSHCFVKLDMRRQNLWVLIQQTPNLLPMDSNRSYYILIVLKVSIQYASIRLIPACVLTVYTAAQFYFLVTCMVILKV